MSKSKKATRKVVRDSRNGRFTKKKEAIKRPATTETELARVPAIRVKPNT